MSSSEVNVRRWTQLHLIAIRKFLALADQVQECGRRPFSHLKRFPDGEKLWATEAEMNIVAGRKADSEKRSIRAIRRLARERGVGLHPDVPVAVQSGGFLFVHYHDDRDNERLLALSLDRIVRLA